MKLPIFIGVLCLPLYTLATIISYTPIQKNVTLYSEYFPNPASSFKGTVIFFNGSGTPAIEWTMNTHFFQCVSQKNSVFLYDRSGLGGSPPNLTLSPKNTNDAKLIDWQLWALLQKQHIPGPYVVVAHSYGGLYGGYFALKHPRVVKAMVMVDPAPRDFEYSKDIVDAFAAPVQDAEKHPASYMVTHYSGPHVETAYLMLGFKASKAEVKALGSIDDNTPVVIASSTQMEYKERPIKGDWMMQQKQWLNKNPKSKIFQLKSGHFIQIDQPDIICDQITMLTR